jgi:hypothetical protein
MSHKFCFILDLCGNYVNKYFIYPVFIILFLILQNIRARYTRGTQETGFSFKKIYISNKKHLIPFKLLSRTTGRRSLIVRSLASTARVGWRIFGGVYCDQAEEPSKIVWPPLSVAMGKGVWFS